MGTARKDRLNATRRTGMYSDVQLQFHSSLHTFVSRAPADTTTSRPPSMRMDRRQTGLWDYGTLAHSDTRTLGHSDTGTLNCKNDSDIFDIQLQRKHPSSFPCSCISPYHLIQIDLQIYSRHRMRALADFQAWSKSSPANPTMLIHSIQIRRHAFSA